MSSKKGISPLIATVLIIGFTIVLAALVMQFATKKCADGMILADGECQYPRVEYAYTIQIIDLTEEEYTLLKNNCGGLNLDKNFICKIGEFSSKCICERKK